MRQKEFPDCCAGLVLSRFGGTKRTYGPYIKYSDQEIEDFFEMIDVELEYNVGFAILTLNDEQINHMKPFLNKFKYECIKSNIHSPNHPGSEVSIYIKCKDE